MQKIFENVQRVIFGEVVCIKIVIALNDNK